MLTEKDRAKLPKKTTLRFRVDMACKDCVYDRFATGTWRKQVQECEIRSCPLWEVRPVQVRQ